MESDETGGLLASGFLKSWQNMTWEVALLQALQAQNDEATICGWRVMCLD